MAHDRRILDGGNDAQPAATAETGEDIESEHRRVLCRQEWDADGGGVDGARRQRCMTVKSGRGAGGRER